MSTRRQFFKNLFSFIIILFTLKYSKILKAMNIRPYHHLPDGTFRNLPGSPQREVNRKSGNFFKFLYKALIKKKMFDRKEIPDDIPNNHYLTQENAIKKFIENKDNISVTWLGHASFLIKLNNECILTDPFLTTKAGPFGVGPSRYIKPGIKISDLPKINTILISHNHYDHLDIKTLIKIKNKNEVTIVCPLKLSKLIKSLGYKKVVELDWYENHDLKNFKIISMPAYHWSIRLGQKRNSTLWCGYLIKYNKTNIYFSGDTAFGPVFSELGYKYGPMDLTLIPIGAYQPRTMMKSSHCTPEEAVEIVTMLKSKNILGMHWGTIRLSAENPWEPPKKFYNAAKSKGYNDSQIWQLAIGQTKSLI
tara:strand:- start:411 stop:1499 length:1089 start_codon:yes stop_codon:yes gene_type:complete